MTGRRNTVCTHRVYEICWVTNSHKGLTDEAGKTRRSPALSERERSKKRRHRPERRGGHSRTRVRLRPDRDLRVARYTATRVSRWPRCQPSPRRSPRRRRASATVPSARRHRGVVFEVSLRVASTRARTRASRPTRDRPSPRVLSAAPRRAASETRARRARRVEASSLLGTASRRCPRRAGAEAGVVRSRRRPPPARSTRRPRFPNGPPWAPPSIASRLSLWWRSRCCCATRIA